MDEKRKWPRAEALAVADELVAALRPFCTRIEVAGSLRRKRPMVGDVEILFVPRFEDRPVDLLGTPEPFNLADEELGRLLGHGLISKRPNVNGTFAWGDKNKLGLHRSGVPIDFFTTSEKCWWVSLVVRTGSKETNLRLTNGALARGDHLNAYGSGVTRRNGTVVDAVSEQHVFDLCGVPYLAPELR